jgi:hypothetical protein
MKIHAHVGPNGNIVALVAAPEGQSSPMLTPSPGIRVCEIENHGIKGDTVDLDQLEKLLKANTVVVTPAHGKLVRRKTKTG